MSPAWSTELADRLREALAGRDVVEKPMFGSLCFMVDGAMLVCAGRGAMLARLSEDDRDTAIAAGHNLGWKLAWVARGWAGEGLLSSYEEERRSIGEYRARRSLQRGGPPKPDPLGEDLGMRYASSVVASDSGGRASHAWVTADGRRRSTLDLFDGRFTLLTGRDAAAWQAAGELEQAAADLDAATTLRASHSDEPDDRLAELELLVAEVAAARDRPDEAMAAATRALARSREPTAMKERLRLNPRLQAMQADPRWHRLLSARP